MDKQYVFVVSASEGHAWTAEGVRQHIEDAEGLTVVAQEVVLEGGRLEPIPLEAGKIPPITGIRVDTPTMIDPQE